MTEVVPFWGRMRPQAACVGSRCQEHSPLNQLGVGREKAPCPASHPSGLLVCRMTLFPPMASAQLILTGVLPKSSRCVRTTFGAPPAESRGALASLGEGEWLMAQ